MSAPREVKPDLNNIRWAVRGILALGLTASLGANVLHAQDNGIARLIAAWPPAALALTVEVISRVPVSARWMSAVRFIATAAIAGIAAYVSYWHMVAVAAHYGETGVSAYLLPVSVDGLVVVASVSLVELTGRIRQADRTPMRAVIKADIRPDIPQAKAVRSARADTPAITAARTASAKLEVPPARRTRPVDDEDPAIKAVRLRGENPDMKQEDIAKAIGRSVRQVRRYLNPPDAATA